MGCNWQDLWIPPLLRNYPNWIGNARSQHMAGVNACFADGSVRYIRDSVPHTIWFYMNSRNDGQVYQYE